MSLSYYFLDNGRLPTPPHVDPSTIPLRELARIRGSMWTARLDVAYGPRPYQPTNILEMGSLRFYPQPEERQRQIDAYTSRGYTHTDIGPWIPPDNASGGYHQQYPFTTQTFDEYLDQLQLLWDNHIVPICFLKPDNWDAGKFDWLLDTYYTSPRAQQLIRASCIAWEPSKDTPNAEWVRWAQAQARVLPHALRCLHMEADFDAPGNNDDFTPSSPTYIGMGQAWQRVAPYLHVYLNQTYGYMAGGNPIPQPAFLTEFAKLFNPADPGSLVGRFTTGYAGYPTSSAWGTGKRLLVCAAEFAATADYHWDWPEVYARQIGDFAMAHGADGYLDGGTVDVPTPRGF